MKKILAIAVALLLAAAPALAQLDFLPQALG